MTESKIRRGIRVALVGVGNCASALVQGVRHYRGAEVGTDCPGLSNVELAGYHVRDIVFSAAFDVSAHKVGRDLAEAIGASPNNTLRFAEVPPLGVTVRPGPTLDGIGPMLRDVVPPAREPPIDVARHLRETQTDVVVSYLPVGSEVATRFYAEQALQAGCAFVNCVPVFIASDPAWGRRFAEARLPLIGDDIKSQVGATILHRALTALFLERGAGIDRTYQLNFGGNADFLNMLERDRLQSKKLSKTRAVTSLFDRVPPESAIHVGPSDHVPWLEDRKWCHIRIEGAGFGGAPLSVEVKLEVWDSPNSAGIVVDAVRCAKLALDRSIGGPLVGPSAWYMKSPPHPMADAAAHAATVAFVQGGRG